MSEDKVLPRFLEDVKDHSMNIIKEDGVYRHISFTRNGSSVYRFDLITWPGHLCICGDMGTYVFNRIRDMFEFFWMNGCDFNNPDSGTLNINPYYWSGKCESVCRQGEIKEFCPDTALQSVEEYFKDEEDEDEDKLEAINDLIKKIRDIDNTQSFFDALYQSDLNIDCCEWVDVQKYTHNYLWICYAIVYGIKSYREGEQCPGQSS